MSNSATPPFTLIGLTGLAGAGKDAVADILRAHCGSYTASFAGHLRAEISNAFRIDSALLTDRATKEQPTSELALERCSDTAFVDRMVVLHMSGAPDGGIEGGQIDLSAPRSPRQIMQWWGTEYRRAQNPNYWTAKAHRHIAWMAKAFAPRAIILTDVRFDNEAQLVRTWHGQIWQVNRPSQASTAAEHVSEVTGEQFLPDDVIHNTGDLQHLKATALSAYAAHTFGLPGLRVELPATASNT